jgi:hypothetical protein
MTSTKCQDCVKIGEESDQLPCAKCGSLECELSLNEAGLCEECDP